MSATQEISFFFSFFFLIEHVCVLSVLRPAPQGSVSLCERRMERTSESTDVPLSDPPKAEPEELLDPSPLVSVPAEHITAGARVTSSQSPYLFTSYICFLSGSSAGS